MFSGTIISSVIHDGSIKRTAEWQLLLGAIALPGCFVGAWLCNRLGRRNTVSPAHIAVKRKLHTHKCWTDDVWLQRLPHLRYVFLALLLGGSLIDLPRLDHWLRIQQAR